MAINNYRQTGGGNFPAVKTAPVLSNGQQEIRQRIIDYVVAHGTLDAAVFSQSNWLSSIGQRPAADRHRLILPPITIGCSASALLSADNGSYGAADGGGSCQSGHCTWPGNEPGC